MASPQRRPWDDPNDATPDDGGRESLLRALGGPGPDFRDLRAFADGKPPETVNLPVDDFAGLDAFIAHHTDRNLFFGVATRNSRSGGRADDCAELWALFCDIDFKDTPEAEARQNIAAFPIAPSAVVQSGGGLHVYYRLTSPIFVRGMVDKIKGLNRALATALGGDMNATDAARILRLPGTLNHKYTPPRACVVETIDTERRYNLDDILRVLPPVPDEPDAKGKEEPSAHGLSVEERVKQARAWLAKQKPAIQGDGGDDHTFHVAAGVAKGHDLAEDQALELLREWNARCTPPWSEADLRVKLQRGIKYGTGQRGEKLKVGGEIVLVRASDVQTKKLDWTWYPRVARGALTLLEGAPDKGKSTLLVDIAARTTRGVFMPGEVPGSGETRTPANVIMLVAEDDPATTVVPRLIAADADLQRVFFLTATRDEKGAAVPFHLTDDGERLARKVREVDAALVILDPLVSFLGSRKGRKIDSYNDLDVRQSLQPLLELEQAAVIGIRHYKKGKGTDPLEAGAGSIGFTAVARVMLAALADPDDPDRYLLAVAKNNLVPKKDRATISYRIVPSESDPTIGRIAWGEEVQVSAADVLEAQASPADSSHTSEAKTAAATFLRERLKDGELVASDDITSAAEEAGISKRTLWRAKTEAGVKTRKKGKVWFWYLPGTQAPLDPTESQL